MSSVVSTPSPSPSKPPVSDPQAGVRAAIQIGLCILGFVAVDWWMTRSKPKAILVPKPGEVIGADPKLGNVMSCPWCYGQGQGTISFEPGSVNGRMPGPCLCCKGKKWCTEQEYYAYERGMQAAPYEGLTKDEEWAIQRQNRSPGTNGQDFYKAVHPGR